MKECIVIFKIGSLVLKCCIFLFCIKKTLIVSMQLKQATNSENHGETRYMHSLLLLPPPQPRIFSTAFFSCSSSLIAN